MLSAAPPSITVNREVAETYIHTAELYQDNFETIWELAETKPNQCRSVQMQFRNLSDCFHEILLNSPASLLGRSLEETEFLPSKLARLFNKDIFHIQTFCQ